MVTWFQHQRRLMGYSYREALSPSVSFAGPVPSVPVVGLILSELVGGGGVGGSICKPVPTRPWGKRHWPSKLGLCLPSTGSHWTTFLDLAVLDLWKSNQSARRRPGNGNRGVALYLWWLNSSQDPVFFNSSFSTLELKGGIRLCKGVRILLFVSMAT